MPKDAKKLHGDYPEAYKTGFVVFLGCKIDLSCKTLIPRPETEFWAQAAINYVLQKKIKEPKILDLCCGSGCLGVAALKKIKNSCVRFVDIDIKAIKQTKINLQINKIDKKRAKVAKSDLFEKLPKDAEYDAIFVNAPYCDKKRIGEFGEGVLKYEPGIALWGGGKKGLGIIKKIIKQAKRFLADGGALFLEFDPSQELEIKDSLKNAAYKKTELRRDQYGKTRYAVAEIKA